MKYKLLPFYLLSFILFFFLMCPEFVHRSMYNDGIWYAILSNNLANDIGSFWNPKLTETIFPVFHEHPPLVFGIQSLFFRVLGGSIVIERIYALTIFLLTALFVVLIWRLIFTGKPEYQKLWFFPLSFWLINEVTYRFYPANVLEGTMGIFAIASIYCLLFATGKSFTSKTLGIIVAGGVLLFGATLSKGFVGLFPLAFFAIYWLVFRRFSFSQMFIRSLLLIAVLLVCYGFMLSFDAAYESLSHYFNSQVSASITGERIRYHHRENQLYIIRRLFEILLPAILLTGLLLMLFRKKISNKKENYLQYALLFLFIGFSASLPLIVSPKQSFYYLLPSLPYFALSLSILLFPIFDSFFGINPKSLRHKIFSSVSLLLFVGAIVFTAMNFGKVEKRDEIVFQDVQEIQNIIPVNSILSSCAYTAHLVGYLYRENKISIDTTDMFKYKFLISEAWDVDTAYFQKVDIPTRRFHLYRQIQVANPQ